MSTGKVYRNIAVVQQKIYSYLTRFKNVAFQAKKFLRTTTKGPPPRCLPQGPHHPRSTPDDKGEGVRISNYVVICESFQKRWGWDCQSLRFFRGI